jgi:YCII-related domain
MPKFILSYRSAKTHDWFADPEGLAAWGAFLDHVVGPKVVDVGWPSFDATALVGETGDTTLLGGYSIVEADDFETAVSMAQHCPTVERGGGVEVAALADLPPEHPAEQIRLRLATSARSCTTANYGRSQSRSQ